MAKKTDWIDLKEVPREVEENFVYLEEPRVFPGTEGRHLAVLSRVLPLWGTNYRHRSGKQLRRDLQAVSLAVVCSDKDLYRQDEDRITLLILDPTRPDEDVELVVELAGREHSRREVHLDWNGAAVFPLDALLAGEYRVRVGDASTTFEVAVYNLSPMTPSRPEFTLDDAGQVEMSMRLETLPARFSGKVAVTIMEGERPVHGPVECEVVDGELQGSFPLDGEGPFAAHVRALDDSGLDVQIPIQGSRKQERAGTRFSRLGVEIEARAMKVVGGQECRGLWLKRGASNNEPVLVRDLVAPVGRFEVRAPLDHAVLTVLHPAERRIVNRPLGSLSAGEVVEFAVQAPYSIGILGGLTGDKPWEGHAVFLPPSELALEVACPASSEPGSELEVTLETGNPAREASVFLVVRDARLRPTDHPRVALAAAVKGEVERYLAGAEKRRSLARNRLAPPPPPPPRPEVTSRSTEERSRWITDNLVTPRRVDGAPRLRMGETLIAAGLINAEHVREAIARQKVSGKRIGQVLVEMRAVTERDVTEALSRQLNVPFIDLSNFIVDPAIAKVIPEYIAQRHQMIPINKVGNRLTVAVVDPLNILAIDDVALLSGLQVKIVVATPSDIQRALSEAFAPRTKMEEVLDDIGQHMDLEDDVGDLDGELGESDAPIISLVNRIVTQAIQRGASVIRIVPEPKQLRVEYRVDDEQYVAMQPPKRSQAAILSRIKIMAGLDIAERRRAQRGVVLIRAHGSEYDLEVSTRPGEDGEEAFIQILAGGEAALGGDDLATRETDPDVVFAGLVHVRGSQLVKVWLGEGLGTFEVDAFAIAGWDWAHATRQLTVAKDTFGELTLPRYLHPEDACQGRLDVAWAEPGTRISLTKDGEEVALDLTGLDLGKPGSGTLRFPVVPGSFECRVSTPSGRLDAARRDVLPPGTIRAPVRQLKVLRPGESIDLDSSEALSFRVVPEQGGLLADVGRANAGYEHCCCEQTASKILGAYAWYGVAATEEDRRQAEEIILAGVARERGMWIRGQGLRTYPRSQGVSELWGKMAVERLACLPLLPKPRGCSAVVTAGLATLAELVTDLVRVYSMDLSIPTMATLFDGYRAGVGAAERLKEAIRLVDRKLVVEGDRVAVTGCAYATMYERAEAAYGAASILRSQDRDRLETAFSVVDWIGRQREATGTWYGPIDNSACLFLASELARLSGGKKLSINGRVMTHAQYQAYDQEVGRIEAVDGPLLLEVERMVEEDWTEFRSSFPVRVELEGKSDGSALVDGDRTKLTVELGDYDDGDLAHVFLPPSLARVKGGGKLQAFQVDFEGRKQLEVPLLVQGAPRNPGGATQRFFVCARNMYDPERVGNPGVQEVTLGG